jgi:hypothetical protein
MLGFFETSFMAYQLPSTKPVSPNPVDLGTRVMPDPSPVVTQYSNPSSEHPAFFSCLIQKAYTSDIKTLKCFATDGANILFYNWDDQGIERNWTDLQVENGMRSNEFFLIGSGLNSVEVMHLVIDDNLSAIRVDKSEILKDC